jgi:hypothetical protein
MLLVANESQQKQLVAALDGLPYGGKIGALSTVADLSDITFGQRIELSKISEKNVFSLPFQVLLRKDEQWVAAQKVAEAYGFCRMVVKGLEKIALRDRQTFHYTPSADEYRAGIERLNFGFVGTIDSIARRMGIGYEEVEQLPEIRVYYMLKIDFETAQYERRLRKVKEPKRTKS